MKNRTVLLIMNSSTSMAWLSQFAENSLRDNIHLLCLVIDPAPSLPMQIYGLTAYGAMTVPTDWPETVSRARAALKASVQEREQILANAKASGEVLGALVSSAEVKGHVARCAKVSDEAFFADNMRDHESHLYEAVSAILYDSPIGFHINTKGKCIYPRIFVAWDSSKAAASAVHSALCYLQEAEEVVIGCIDPSAADTRDGQEPGADIAKWLSHHGCTVTLSQTPSGGRAIPQCIEDRAREVGADLIVMGAYGHARIVQTVLGGTTRHMIEQRDLPVFFAH